MALEIVDPAGSTYDHTCAACGFRAAQVPTRQLHSETSYGAHPGALALSHTCTACGAVECFNTALSSADEDETQPGNYTERAAQARMIRQVQRHLGHAVAD